MDNSVFSFGYQLRNGIPIIPYYDDAEDNELYKFIDYMKILKSVDDVRLVIDKSFNSDTLREQYASF